MFDTTRNYKYNCRETSCGQGLNFKFILQHFYIFDIYIIAIIYYA